MDTRDLCLLYILPAYVLNIKNWTVEKSGEASLLINNKHTGVLLTGVLLSLLCNCTT